MRVNGFRLAWLATAIAAGLVALPPAPLAGAAAADACQTWNGSQPLGAVTMEASCTVSRNDVLRQNPDGGVTVPSGSPVSLVESTGRQPNGKLCVVN